MKKRIKVAQVGTNYFTHAFQTYESMLKFPEEFEVIGVAEPVESCVGNLETGVYRDQPHYTVEQLLNMDDLDAVAIETNEENMTEYAQMFADRGVAVHMDKPGSPGSASFAHLASTLEQKGLPFQLGYMYRFNPLIQRAMDEIAKGNLGEILNVEAQMSVRYTPENRQWLGKFKGGMMFYLGCHMVELVYRLQGLPQEILPMNMCTGTDGVTAEDQGLAILKYPRGVSIIKTNAIEYNGFDRRNLVITGTRGTIELKPLERYTAEGLYTYGVYTHSGNATNHYRDCSEKWSAGPYDRYDAMMLEFAKLVRGEMENPFSYAYETELFRLVMQCCGAE